MVTNEVSVVFPLGPKQAVPLRGFDSKLRHDRRRLFLGKLAILELQMLGHFQGWYRAREACHPL